MNKVNADDLPLIWKSANSGFVMTRQKGLCYRNGPGSLNGSEFIMCNVTAPDEIEGGTLGSSRSTTVQHQVVRLLGHGKSDKFV